MITMYYGISLTLFLHLGGEKENVLMCKSDT